MAEYKFDGRWLTRSGTRIAEVDGRYVKSYESSIRVAEVDGNYIKDYRASQRVLEVSGDKVIEYSSRRELATVSSVRRVIEGPGGITLVALWYFFLR